MKAGCSVIANSTFQTTPVNGNTRVKVIRNKTMGLASQYPKDRGVYVLLQNGGEIDYSSFEEMALDWRLTVCDVCGNTVDPFDGFVFHYEEERSMKYVHPKCNEVLGKLDAALLELEEKNQEIEKLKDQLKGLQ